ncbi:MAG: hypothetical protein JNK16_14885 [Phycisphaerales bacterium]|nr:hypothetical protein [Phycisphaerales bacterium]
MPRTPSNEEPQDPLRSIDLETARPSRDFHALVPFDFAWRHRFCAVSIDDTHDLIVATDDTPPSVIAKVTEAMPRPCQLALATDEQICRLIARTYEQSRST